MSDIPLIFSKESTTFAGDNVSLVFGDTSSGSRNILFEKKYVIPGGKSANITFGGDGISIPAVVGVSNSTISKLLVQGSLLVVITATGNVTLGKLTASGQLAQITMGQSDTSIRKPSLSGSAVFPFLAKGNFSVRPLTASGVAWKFRVASSNAVIGSIESTSSGFAFVSGSFNGSLGPITSSGSGYLQLDVYAEGNLVIPPFTITAVGGVPNFADGVGNAVIGPITAHGTNTIDYLISGFATIGGLKTQFTSGLHFGPAYSNSIIGPVKSTATGIVRVAGWAETSIGDLNIGGSGWVQVVAEADTTISEIRSFVKFEDLRKPHFEGESYEISTRHEAVPKTYGKEYVGSVYINETRYDIDENRLKSASLVIDFEYIDEMLETVSLNVWVIKPGNVPTLLQTVNKPFENHFVKDNNYFTSIQVVTLRENDLMLEYIFKDRITGQYESYQEPINTDYADHPFISVAFETAMNTRARLSSNKLTITDFKREEIRGDDSIFLGGGAMQVSTLNRTNFVRIERVEIEGIVVANTIGMKGVKYETDDLGRIQIGG